MIFLGRPIPSRFPALTRAGAISGKRTTVISALTGNPAILVAQAASQTMNPAIDMEWVGRQFEEDPIAAEAEYNAQFRSDVEAFVDREIVEACIERGCHEISPCGGKTVFGFVDAAGGNSGDSMTLAVAHMEGDVATLDCIRERKPPFSPAAVCEEFSAVFKSYGLQRVTADKWGSAFVTEAFASNGIECRQSAKPKSDIYRELLPMLMSGNVRLSIFPSWRRKSSALRGKPRAVAKDSSTIPRACMTISPMLQPGRWSGLISVRRPCRSIRLSWRRYPGACSAISIRPACPALGQGASRSQAAQSGQRQQRPNSCGTQVSRAAR